MNPILRQGLSRATRVSILPVYRPRTARSPALSLASRTRTYAQSSYGGEGQPNDQQPEDSSKNPTRNKEHPGPPPPGQESPNGAPTHPETGTTEATYDPIPRRPSNHAKPTIVDGRQTPLEDPVDGHVNEEEVPEDVKKHNEDVDHRYDKTYDQIDDQGRVRHGWKHGE